VEYKLLRETISNVEASYINDLPAHILPSARLEEYDPAASCIFVVEWNRFKSMSTSAIQDIFRHRHIHVLDAPVDTVEFDREGLESLGSLTSVRSVQGKLLDSPYIHWLISSFSWRAAINYQKCDRHEQAWHVG